MRRERADGRSPPRSAYARVVLIAAVEAERPPVHLLLGGDALDQWRARPEAWRRETDAWEAVTRGTASAPPGAD